jgi:hypothetical protein
MPAARLAFGGCLLAGAAALAVTLSHSPISVIRVSSDTRSHLGSLRRPTSICQSDEALPRDTSALRLQLFAYVGPRVTVAAYVNERVIARGERGSGWTGGSVTVPVSRVAVGRAAVMLCMALAVNGDEGVALGGQRTDEALAAQTPGGPLPGRLRVEDLRPARSSWWSLLLPVARRFGLGRGPSGSWSALLAAVLVLLVVGLSARVVLRELA